ncbi:MAG TPA: quinone-dependent dihydroorotate dehydrogenase [Thermoanaerobaculia bacterium]|jgi:dihydroorotate dehydrogenase|nr:quinone-dependent dihydroorotate dehydrogenase [Thermoanaerobaculia bacterium]
MYSLIRKLLFLLDAEDAHDFTTRQMIALQNIPLVLRAISRFCTPPASARRELLGLTFPSPIGIAAGFDKNGLLMPMLVALGFGFVEVGTVTLRPQPGNPRPRLFRYPDHKALINRLGFNNDGADAVAARLASWKRTIPLFINIGKNRDVPLEGAADDYGACAMKLAPLADAVVVNLSSPNTPSLRELQRPEHLERILTAVGPALVKIAPDIDDAMLAEVCDVCVKRARGMICTNTTIARPFPSSEVGGLSGAPLMNPSTSILERVRERVGPSFPLISVGGVFTADDVLAKNAAGADLVQIYTGFIYEGPLLPSRLSRGVSRVWSGRKTATDSIATRE